MSVRDASAAPVSYAQLRAICICLGLALATHVASLPLWLPLTVGALVALRLRLAALGRAAPGRVLRLVLSALTIGLLFLQFHTFNGLAAGSALLCLMAGLKVLETRTRRDLYIVTLIIYFLILAAMLQNQSFWLLGLVVGVWWLTSAAWLRITAAAPPPGWRRSVGYAGRILAQALPLTVIFWLFFPRFDGPLWQLPPSAGGAESGLSDSMSPGDITDLVQSDDIAFRVHFLAATPPAAQRYWRGPVLHDFDGHTWRRGEAGGDAAGAGTVPQPAAGAYPYSLSLEPHDHHWIFALDWPTRWNLPGAVLTSDYMLVGPAPVSQPIEVLITSVSQVAEPPPLGSAQRRRDTQLPPGRNARTIELARELRDAHADDGGYVQAVLDRFHTEPFYYTLSPPPLGADSVDEFLFETRRGFCGHYASAFATLMRAGGIPARVVTGYHGGTYNRFADYWIVRQSDAHAWVEIWVRNQGWLRVDPTSAVAAGRVERGAADLGSAAPAFAGSWHRTPWLADLRLRIDALRSVWRARILLFDHRSQDALLGLLHIPEPDAQKLVMVLGVGLALGLAYLTWQVRRESQPPEQDPTQRAYARLCRKLASAGLPRSPHEGAEAYGARVARLRPDLAAPVTALCASYSRLRYGPGNGSGTGAARAARQAFAAAVRGFHPGAARRASVSS
jgi:transglutaminase-like putative cysteine protease